MTKGFIQLVNEATIPEDIIYNFKSGAQHWYIDYIYVESTSANFDVQIFASIGAGSGKYKIFEALANNLVLSKVPDGGRQHYIDVDGSQELHFLFHDAAGAAGATNVLILGSGAVGAR